MKIGLLAYSTNTGLGIQTQEFYNHIDCEKVMLIDISKYNKIETHHDRFPDACVVTSGYPTNQEIDQFLEGLDLVFIAETPLNFYLYEKAEQLGIKVVNQFNWEFFDYVDRPNLPKPTIFGAPSTWEWETFPYKDQRVQLKCPVNREKLPPREIKQFKKFLHIAGNPAKHDRNGTGLVIEAFRIVDRVDTTLTIRCQDKEYSNELRKFVSSNVTIDDTDLENYNEMYDGFDCMILPRKYGGNCLPMNEALSCGMPVIMSDISPNNDILPLDWLVPANKVAEFTPRPVVGIYETPPKLLADCIKEFASKTEEDCLVDNDVAKGLGDFISWERQKPIYMKLFEELVDKS